MNMLAVGWRGWAVRVVEAVWRAVLPTWCAGCGAPDVALCGPCLAALGRPPRRSALARPGTGDLPVLSLAACEGEAWRVRGAIAGFKDRERWDARAPLAGALGRVLAEACVALPPGTDAPALVTPPPRARAWRRRGYWPVAELLRAAGADGLVADGLVLTRRVHDQRGLDAAARRENVAEAFVAAPRLSGRDVLIVDDVVTTGATVLAAARAVEAAGGRVRGAVALWRVPRGGADAVDGLGRVARRSAER